VFANYPLKSYKVLELDDREDGDAVQDYLGKLTGGRSVPRVFIGGRFIGGGDDTAAAHAKGELQAKLEAANAL
jgi:glutaredoxin 3